VDSGEVARAALALGFRDVHAERTPGPPTSKPKKGHRWAPFDGFIYKVASDVRAAVDGSTVPRRYIVANTAASFSGGAHWVAVVYEIERASDGQVLQGSVTPAAPSHARDEGSTTPGVSSSGGLSHHTSAATTNDQTSFTSAASSSRYSALAAAAQRGLQMPGSATAATSLRALHSISTRMARSRDLS
jgi:hypothetical protein